MHHLSIVNVAWHDDQARQALKRIREQVFIVEQNVAVSLEWDDADANATHVLVMAQVTPNSQAQAVACARIVDDDELACMKIGRMAVLSAWRRQGIGQALLQHCIATCRRYQVSDRRLVGDGEQPAQAFPQAQVLPQDQASIQLSAQTHAIAFYEKAGFVVTSAPYLDADILHVDMVWTA